ncbi:hypothetical protein ACWN8B_00120 [Vagococcus zengguangii]|uniref:WxL domain-containing protein n=1 Tax=Vagococcus zengguangii TaxID=2571750 RepID=A0A4D7CQ85_9ENTE|nr:hypothetical protein [Vagococcus zengguangii]QCI86325.1 hypothetical protein FA707_04810 [Vagococcus zengguangii]
MKNKHMRRDLFFVLLLTFPLVATKQYASQVTSTGTITIPQGTLLLEDVSSTIDYGKIEQPIEEEVYSIKVELTVNDTREALPGWDVFVKNAPVNWDEQNLKLSIDDKQTISSDESVKILSYDPATYENTTTEAFKVFLTVGPNIQPGLYETKLIWELGALPK